MIPTTFTTTLTPVGELIIESDGEFLTRIGLPTARRAPTGRRDPAHALLANTVEQLRQYFAQQRTTFDLPTRVEGTTFQRDVWAQLERIPYGATITYGELARRVSRPGAARAVGGANARNPLPIVVPCHRVVASAGLGGYAGGVAMKHTLLELERRR